MASLHAQSHCSMLIYLTMKFLFRLFKYCLIVDSVQYFPGLNCRTSYLHIYSTVSWEESDLGLNENVFTTFAKMRDFVYFAEFFIYANIFE